MEGLHGMAAVVGFGAQPHGESVGKSVDQVHHGDLGVFLVEVLLVDAHRIDPKRYCLRVMSSLSKKSFEVLCHFDLLIVDDNVLLNCRVAPCVRECLESSRLL